MISRYGIKDFTLSEWYTSESNCGYFAPFGQKTVLYVTKSPATSQMNYEKKFGNTNDLRVVEIKIKEPSYD